MHKAYRGEPCLGGDRARPGPANPDAIGSDGHLAHQADQIPVRVSATRGTLARAGVTPRDRPPGPFRSTAANLPRPPHTIAGTSLVGVGCQALGERDHV